MPTSVLNESHSHIAVDSAWGSRSRGGDQGRGAVSSPKVSELACSGPGPPPAGFEPAPVALCTS